MKIRVSGELEGIFREKQREKLIQKEKNKKRNKLINQISKGMCECGELPTHLCCNLNKQDLLTCDLDIYKRKCNKLIFQRGKKKEQLWMFHHYDSGTKICPYFELYRLYSNEQWDDEILETWGNL